MRPGLRSAVGTWPRHTWHPKRPSCWSSSASSSGCSPPSAGSSTSWCPCTYDRDPEPVCQELLVAQHLGREHGQLKWPQPHVARLGLPWEMSDHKVLSGPRGSVRPSGRVRSCSGGFARLLRPANPGAGRRNPEQGDAGAVSRWSWIWARSCVRAAAPCVGSGSAVGC